MLVLYAREVTVLPIAHGRRSVILGGVYGRRVLALLQCFPAHVVVRTHACCSGVGWSAAPWTTLKKALHLVVDTVSGSEPDDIAYVTSGCVGAFAGYEWCCLSPSKPRSRVSLRASFSP